MVSVFQIHVLHVEKQSGRLVGFAHCGIEASLGGPSFTAGQTPLASSSSPLTLHEEHPVMVVHQQCESGAAHRRTGVMDPAAPRVFRSPFPNDPHVRPEGQVVIVGQHIGLEPLGVQAFPSLDPDMTAQAFAPPYLKGMAVAFVGIL